MIKRLFPFLLVMIILPLEALESHNLLLRAQADVYPKILMMDKMLGQKLVDGAARFLIVFDAEESRARAIKEMVDLAAFQKNSGLVMSVDVIPISEFDQDTAASAVFVVDGKTEQLLHIGRIAKERGIVSFSYAPHALHSGLLFSLAIERETKIYVNFSAISAGNIGVVESLGAAAAPYLKVQ